MPLTLPRIGTLAAPRAPRLPRLRLAPVDRVLAIVFHCAVVVTVAALVHLALILAWPWRAKETAYDRVWTTVGHIRLKTAAAPPLSAHVFPYRDPLLAAAFCVYDLRDGPVHVTLDVGTVGYAAVSAHSRHGLAFYGLTNRSAANASVNLVLMTAAQAAQAANADESGDEPSNDLRVTAPEAEGFVLAEALGAPSSVAAEARRTADSLKCATATR